MFFGFNSIYHPNVFIPSSHFPKRPPIATQSLEGGVKGHNTKGRYLTGKPRPLGRGTSLTVPIGIQFLAGTRQATSKESFSV
jgi:hypothetical protein